MFLDFRFPLYIRLLAITSILNMISRMNFFPGDTKHTSSFLSSQEIGCDVIVDQSTLNENKAPSGKHQIFFLAFSFYNNLITVGARIPNMFGIQMVEVCLVFIWSLVFKWSEPLRNRTKLLAQTILFLKNFLFIIHWASQKFWISNGRDHSKLKKMAAAILNQVTKWHLFTKPFTMVAK